jgi:hypothetical protein
MLNPFIRIVISTVLPKRWQARPAGPLHQVLSLSVRVNPWLKFRPGLQDSCPFV